MDSDNLFQLCNADSININLGEGGIAAILVDFEEFRMLFRNPYPSIVGL